MGSELQGKYQKLAQEYAKLRSHVDVLKKAVKDEQNTNTSLEESLREMRQSLRKHVQENESLEFRNQQLSKRVGLLQEELNNPSKSKKRKGNADGLPTGAAGIHAQELASKITENEKLHMKVLEVTQRSERSISGLETKIESLEREVSLHTAAMEELQMEHESKIESVLTERAMLEAKLAKQSSELEALKETGERQLLNGPQNDLQNLIHSGTTSGEQWLLLSDTSDATFAALNVPVVDTKLQSEVLTALKGGVDLISTFTTQMSTFHSYLEQRCKVYPVDSATGLQMSIVNQKLCELLHCSSSYTRPLVSTLVQYCEKLGKNLHSQTICSDLEEFANVHHKFVAYLETLTPYLQLSLQEESSESVCGVQLLEKNVHLSQVIPQLVKTFSSVDDYFVLIASGPSGDIPPSNLVTSLVKLQISFSDVQHALEDLCGHFSSKIAQEYQLPTASQKLNTTNECIVSALTGMISTAEQLSGFLESSNECFSNSLMQSSPGTENKMPSGSSVVQKLRLKAAGYFQKLQADCPESVPYTLAVYNSKAMSSSSENRDTLLRQMTTSQGKLSKLEQEKEQLILDLQLLNVKLEKEQKKVAALEGDLAHYKGHPSFAQQPLNTSGSSLVSNPQRQSLSASVGSLTGVSVDANEEETGDEAVREELIRSYFTTRMAGLNSDLQKIDSKAAQYYAQCRAMHKQLTHSATIKNKITCDLQTANDTIQQLQDQLATTATNYEKQLSAMSDHLCELNDKLLKRSDELELLRKSKSKRWGK